MNRYLVLIQFAAKLSRKPDAPGQVRRIREIIAQELEHAESVMSSETALAFCGLSPRSASALWKALKLPIEPDDTLSVLEICANIATTHPGLSLWQVQTRWLAQTGTEQPG
jgi:hypothetical protein